MEDRGERSAWVTGGLSTIRETEAQEDDGLWRQHGVRAVLPIPAGFIQVGTAVLANPFPHDCWIAGQNLVLSTCHTLTLPP